MYPLATGATDVAELAGYLQREITQRGWSRREAATNSGMRHSTLNKILNDPGLIPDLDTLKKLAQGFGIPLRRLIELCGFSLDSDIGPASLTDADRAALDRLPAHQRAALLDLAQRMADGDSA